MRAIAVLLSVLWTIARPLVARAERVSHDNSATLASGTDSGDTHSEPLAHNRNKATQAEQPFSATGRFAYERWRAGGLYAGAHVAYNFGSSRSALSFASASTNTFGSLYGGLQLGYLLPLHSQFVIGIESDVSFPNFLAGNDVVASLKSDDATYIEQLDCLGTLRSRVGYAWSQWLGYVTGGLVWSRARFSETLNNESANEDKARLLTGIGLGIGAEAGIAWQWTARIEFIHDELIWGEAQFGSGAAVTSKIRINSLRLGLGWLP